MRGQDCAAVEWRRDFFGVKRRDQVAEKAVTSNARDDLPLPVTRPGLLVREKEMAAGDPSSKPRAP